MLDNPTDSLNTATLMNNPYPHPTPLDVDAFRQGIEKLDQCKEQISAIISLLEKHKDNLWSIRTEAKNAMSYANDVIEATEQESEPSVETIAGFYSSLKSLDIYVNHIKFNAPAFKDTIHLNTIENLDEDIRSAVKSCSSIPLRQRQAVDNSQ